MLTASRAEGETGIVVWRYDPGSVTKLCVLQTGSYVISFLRFSVRCLDSDEPGYRLVSSGMSGEIFEFDVPASDLACSKGKKSVVRTIAPTNVHTEVRDSQSPTAPSRAVVESSDGRFLVAAHGNNHVSLWQRSAE